MFDRPRSGERAVLVSLDLDRSDHGGLNQHTQEFQELVNSAGAASVGIIGGKRRAPDPRYFVGQGKAEEIATAVAATEAQLVIVNHDLSPAQERNLEQRLKCRVLDRNGLILDIFAQRARSFEGKLQVELAQLRHLSTRLVRGWTHLERQKGGIGLRGPGETQLETDRRLISERIKQINRRLQRVNQQRDLSRQKRQKAKLATVALVGYTNAGKSTLFNQLTCANSYAADQLFATLDPTLRRLELAGAEPMILADTVGFISALPHELVAAFRATLQETAGADLLLHVIDSSDSERQFHAEEVDRVLAEIGAERVPQLRVYNKVDRLGIAPRLERDDNGQIVAVWLSARTGEGIEHLKTALIERAPLPTRHGWIQINPNQGRLRARFYDLNAVLGETAGPNGVTYLEIRTSERNLAELSHHEGLDLTQMSATPLLDEGKISDSESISRPLTCE